MKRPSSASGSRAWASTASVRHRTIRSISRSWCVSGADAAGAEEEVEAEAEAEADDGEDNAELGDEATPAGSPRRE